MLSKLRFRYLQLLELFGRTRNLRVAAEQMHVTQPAATKILSDLEAMFGTQLFERLPREMRPTDLGALSVRYAVTTLSNLGKFSGEFATLKNGGYGHLTVGFIPASAAQLVTAAIKEIQRKHPRLIIKLVEEQRSARHMARRAAARRDGRTPDSTTPRSHVRRRQPVGGASALIWTCRYGAP